MDKDEQVLEDISEGLRKIANLLALEQLSSYTQQVEKVMVLNAVGYSHADAAELLGTTADTVRVTVNREKRKSSDKAGNKKSSST